MSWVNKVDTRSMNDTDLSSRQIQEAEGEVAFKETKPKVIYIKQLNFLLQAK